MIGERRVYRGWSTKEAIVAYHHDALAAMQSGYVPVEEKWSQALGLATLTVTYDQRPGEVAAVLGMLASSPALHPRNSLRARLGRQARTVLATIAALVIVVATVAAPSVLGWTAR